MIKTAPQGPNSVDGRENTSRLLIKFNEHTVHGLMAQWYEASLLALEEVGCRFKSKQGYFQFLYIFYFLVLLFLSSYF